MKKFLIYFIFLTAISLAGIVAYVSITGLLTVFSGVGFLGLLFFLTIEMSKIIATSAIHTYGNKISIFYNILLSLSIFIAMGITSMGVYGFLSSGYQKNVTKSTNSERKITLVDSKLKLKEKSRESVNSQLLQTQSSITQLRNALGNNTQSRVDKKGNVITTSSSENRKAFENQLKIATETESRLNDNLNELDSDIDVLSDSKIELEMNSELSNELGPLKYLSDVTGLSMDNVMKWFILLLIIIGDPMAILMIVIFNKIINESNNEGIIENDEVSDTNYHDTIIGDDDINKYFKDETQVEISLTDENGLSVMGDVEEPKFQERKITIDDLPERNNRGFSVKIPDRKSSNVVERIGANKEVREDNPDKLVFKKRN